MLITNFTVYFSVLRFEVCEIILLIHYVYVFDTYFCQWFYFCRDINPSPRYSLKKDNDTLKVLNEFPVPTMKILTFSFITFLRSISYYIITYTSVSVLSLLPLIKTDFPSNSFQRGSSSPYIVYCTTLCFPSYSLHRLDLVRTEWNFVSLG